MSLNILKDLENKVVIVTGSNSGIGEAIVSLFSQIGSHVVITGRNAERVSKVASKCESLSPHKYKPLTFVGDLLIDENIEKLVQKTIEKFSRIDVVVNNMGANDKDVLGSILDEDFLKKLDKAIKADLEVAVKVARLTLPHLVESKGALINISAAAIDRVCEGYLAEKIFCFSPGFIKTPAFSIYGMTPDQVAEMLKPMSAFNRVGQPEEVANAVAFLASSASSFVTGSRLYTDGGFHLK
ncbi:3-oxoacyl-[acyl-carrier-protein] reductase FabG-like protein [Dinothrombium tinctorium]|uniref:3-oxoacyl-[acyl-carrier-protein] reductase FabG-like protein n=1 Tax=Dinothrombium tinctorium TaxID=1965070 RepID=A0A3S3P545_9ACAR|nr:3-oxoacyl-[acyl-carrier-protein] reductase FabG-like protein [Dinothrombium tinctorium]